MIVPVQESGPAFEPTQGVVAIARYDFEYSAAGHKGREGGRCKAQCRISVLVHEYLVTQHRPMCICSRSRPLIRDRKCFSGKIVGI